MESKNANARRLKRFQCSSASRKFLNRPSQLPPPPGERVSVLFSEPKIPQSERLRKTLRKMRSFSALQRAENSSIPERQQALGRIDGFSALQRAENSSIRVVADISSPIREFQCSSASRKFLNTVTKPCEKRRCGCFSALQRAENSSMTRDRVADTLLRKFQCSSASRKFLNRYPTRQPNPCACVSVLFSEPKIPQLVHVVHWTRIANAFSALQRAENSSMR